MNNFLVKKEPKKVEVPPITQFSGYYEFLSIDYACWVYYEGFMYPSVAMAFQAARTNDVALRRRISEVKEQAEFKKIIVQIQNAPNWHENRLNVMMKLNRDKFKRNKDLGLKFLATQARQLINCYEKGGDAEAFWGMILNNGKYDGLNTLGKIVTQIREDMRKGSDSRKWILDQNI